jgi:hypothetical protein
MNIQVDECRMFRQAKPQLHYAWGGDVAEGMIHGDFSTIAVYCCETGQQVFEYQGKRPTPELGELAYIIGQYYNWAFGSFENNKDQTPNNKLMEVELSYPNLAFQQDWSKGDPRDTDKVGFNTNVTTRYRMIRQFNLWVRDGVLQPFSRALYDEMEIFSANAQGKYAAIPGGFDDLVMGHAIAAQHWHRACQLLTMDDETLRPLVNGREVQVVEGHDVDVDAPQTVPDRIIGRIEADRRDEPDSTMEGMV